MVPVVPPKFHQRCTPKRPPLRVEARAAMGFLQIKGVVYGISSSSVLRFQPKVHTSDRRKRLWTHLLT